MADVRDAVQSFLSGNSLDAALNLAGIVPGPGDGVKVGAAVGFFLGKHPGKVVEVAEVLFKKAFKVLPEEVTVKVLEPMFEVAARVDQIKVLDIVFDGAATKLLNLNLGADVDDLIVVAKRGSVEKTLFITKGEGGSTVWLEVGMTDAEAAKIGRTGSGFKHAMEHENDFKNMFGISGEEKIKEQIIESIKNPTKTQPDPKGGTQYILEMTDVDGDKAIIKTIVGDNGYIVTSFPEKIKS